MRKKLLASIVAGLVTASLASAAFASTPPGQKGYEGKPGNQGNGQQGYEGQPGNQGGKGGR